MGQQNMTINRSLQYLITEDIKDQDIVYVQTDGRPDDERVSHKLDWSSTTRAKNCIHSDSTLILQKHIFCIFVPAEQNRLCQVVDHNEYINTLLHLYIPSVHGQLLCKILSRSNVTVWSYT